MPTDDERRWLDYAWSVIDTPAEHLRRCIGRGGATPGEGRVEGNELRWPGYLGRNYGAEPRVLCVGAVHREGTPALQAGNQTIAETDRQLVSAARLWRESGRSDVVDARYLANTRDAYERALPAWSRWNRHFRTLVEDHLRLDRTRIAYTNLAKCRVSIDRGAKQRAAEQALTRLCQQQHPISDVLEAIQPTVVLVAVLGARPGGDVVTSWSSASCSPLVFAWQGQSGHDRHNTAPGARPLREWAPEMAAAVAAACG